MYGIKGLARNLSVILLFALFIYSPAAHSEQFIAKNGEIRGTFMVKKRAIHSQTPRFDWSKQSNVP